MRKRIRYKPSKPASLFGMIAGAIFVLIGVFIVIPSAGLFGIFWTLLAGIMTGIQAYYFFSNKGISSWEIDIDNGSDVSESNYSSSSNGDFETRLRKLHKLKEEGLITKDEFNKKREEIMREKW